MPHSLHAIYTCDTCGAMAHVSAAGQCACAGHARIPKHPAGWAYTPGDCPTGPLRDGRGRPAQWWCPHCADAAGR